MIKILYAILCVFYISVANAAAIDVPTAQIDTPDFVSADDILNRTPDDTKCATAALANALAQTANSVSESDSEQVIQQWIHSTFSSADVLTTVLACPEIAGADDAESIKFLPIKYTFPGGREIVINYETQPKILKQRLLLATKRGLNNTAPSPRIDDSSVWTNIDPAWYAIMVVQHGALDEFAARGKNHTISLQYINDNIDDLYPKNGACTSRSALANDYDFINIAMHNTVGLGDDDTNDYYVAGDINLQWISYLEIALDVVITVATLGSGTVVLGATKAARASRALKGLSTTIKTLSKTEKVRDYVRISQRYTRAAEELKKIDRVKDAAAYERKSAEIKRLGENMRTMEQTEEDVKKYKKATKSFSEINKYRRNLRSLRTPQRGNIIARGWRALRAANTGNKTLSRGARIARSSSTSGRIRDWLFNSTMRNMGMLAKVEAAGGLLYGALKFAGDMYDWTETSTGEFTNNVDFAPLLLLSADDLQGQENVVNYGMWLMWLGDSISAADDDAAYLQAMDTATKFHQDLSELQDEQNEYPCDIDIYVVRPIMQNPGTENAAIYYLIMNDEPWTTHQDK